MIASSDFYVLWHSPLLPIVASCRTRFINLSLSLDTPTRLPIEPAGDESYVRFAPIPQALPASLTYSDTLNKRPKQLHHLLLINLIDACLICLLKF